MTYRERTTLVAGATLWRSTAGPTPKPRLILPDGCLDLLWDGVRRIQRMSRALEQARAGAPLAQVAATCRYVDQAHFCREVQALAGTTPARLLQELDRG